MTTSTQTPPTLTRAAFGTMPGGEAVEAVTLANGTMAVTVITYGAGIQAVQVPDRAGQFADVALGHDNIAPYLDQPQYIGSTVGRVANRIAGGRFVFDSREYHVPVNNGPNSLHGGTTGFDKVNWRILATSTEPEPSVTLGHVSPDGDQGYPGTLHVTATYTLAGDTLSVAYRAVCDAPTLVNITNHAYWNLAGEGAEEGAMGHLLLVPADHYLPTNATAIPTGEMRSVADTPFDFRQLRRVGERVRDAGDEQIRFGHGYDHNWVVAREVADAQRLLARLVHPASGRTMELHSNQPGLQFYSGNFLDGTSFGKAGRLYRMGDAVVLEPQMFPDTPNRPEFGSLRLQPGQVYQNVIEFRFGTAD